MRCWQASIRTGAGRFHVVTSWVEHTCAALVGASLLGSFLLPSQASWRPKKGGGSKHKHSKFNCQFGAMVNRIGLGQGLPLQFQLPLPNPNISPIITSTPKNLCCYPKPTLHPQTPSTSHNLFHLTTTRTSRSTLPKASTTPKLLIAPSPKGEPQRPPLLFPPSHHPLLLSEKSSRGASHRSRSYRQEIFAMLHSLELSVDGLRETLGWGVSCCCYQALWRAGSSGSLLLTALPTTSVA
jgi:hypothetical protein